MAHNVVPSEGLVQTEPHLLHSPQYGGVQVPESRKDQASGQTRVTNGQTGKLQFPHNDGNLERSRPPSSQQTNAADAQHNATRNVPAEGDVLRSAQLHVQGENKQSDRSHSELSSASTTSNTPPTTGAASSGESIVQVSHAQPVTRASPYIGSRILPEPTPLPPFAPADMFMTAAQEGTVPRKRRQKLATLKALPPIRTNMGQHVPNS